MPMVGIVNDSDPAPHVSDCRHSRALRRRLRSFLMSGGKMAVIIESAPHELMTILGAGIAAFLIGNSMTVIKATAGGFGKVFAGPKWKASDYRDLLSLLYMLTKTMKSKGVIALESHIEKPGESSIFSTY